MAGNITIPQLTFTRFLAAFGVVLVHYGQAAYPFNQEEIKIFIPYLTSLVTYFFVLSGFILVISNYKNGEFPVSIEKKTFWKNRLIRIYPLYIFAILLLLIAINDGSSFLGFFGWNTSVAYSVLLLQSWEPGMALIVNYPGWSLSAEAFFYLLFPFLFQGLKPLAYTKLLFLAFGIWLGNNFLYYYLYTNENVLKELFYYYPPLHLSSFVFGICWGMIYIEKREYLKKYKGIILLFFILLLIFFLYSIKTGAEFMKYYHNGMFAPLYIASILIVALDEGVIKRIFSLKLFIYLGEISYGVYILQCPLIYIVSEKFKLMQSFGSTARFFLELILLVVFAAVCHELIEKPARKYFRKDKKPMY
jgi:peptidoglycan/LPS O-acetylase OafA/YrhL